jgi:hypothetical protein
MRRFAIEPVDDGPDMTGQAQLAVELRRTVAWIRFCEAQLQKLDSERDFVYGLVAIETSAASEDGTAPDGTPVDKVSSNRTERYEAKVNVWVERLDWNRAHMLKITKQWIDAGYEAARLELEARTVSMFFETMNAVIATLGHDLDDPDVQAAIETTIVAIAERESVPELALT